MSGAAYNRIGSGDLWGDQPTNPFDELRAGAKTFQGTMHGREPAISPLDFVIERAWLDSAACAGMEEAFEKAANVRGTALAVRDAKAVCASCLVRRECLADAMENETGPASFRHGIRGGLTERERGDLWKAEKDA